MKEAILLKKQQEVNDLSQKFKKAKTVMVIDYHGLNDTQTKEIRRKLRKEAVEMKIYKNNISRRAALALGYKDLVPVLVGAKAIVISYVDIVAPAKILYEYAKQKRITIVKGVVEGKVVGVDALIELASLPSREVLLARLAMGLLAPLHQLAMGLSMINK